MVRALDSVCGEELSAVNRKFEGTSQIISNRIKASHIISNHTLSYHIK